MLKPLSAITIMTLSLGIALFLSSPGFAVEGKEFTPRFQNPPLLDFEVSPPNVYLQNRTNELFQLLEESPEQHDAVSSWLGATKVTYGGIGHNHWQGFATGQKGNHSGLILFDSENEYDFGPKEDRSLLVSSGHQLTPTFYLHVKSSADWTQRPRPDMDDSFPQVNTKGTHQVLSVYTRELNGNHLTHTWVGGTHTFYSDKGNDQPWHNWQLGFSRGYQFFLEKNQPAMLQLSFSGDRLSRQKDSFLRTWNEISFSLTTKGPSTTQIKWGGDLNAFSRYAGTFKLGLEPFIEIGKQFGDKVVGRAFVRSSQYQPTFQTLFFDEAIGSVYLEDDDVQDGEIYDPIWLRQELLIRLSADENISIFLEQKYRKQFYYWEDRNSDLNPELYFTDDGVFIWLAGFSVDTNLSPDLVQNVKLEVENQHHGTTIYPNISDLLLRSEFLLKYRDQSELKAGFDYIGEFYQDRQEQNKVSGSFLIDVSFQQYISRNFTFLLEGLNVTDTNVYDMYGFSEKNRRYRFGVLIQK